MARHKLATGILGFFALCVLIAAIDGGGDDQVQTALRSDLTSPSAAGTNSASQKAAEKAKADAEAKASAEAVKKAAEEAKAKAAAEAKAKAEAASNAAAEAKRAAALKNPRSYASVSKRQLALISKNPDAYKGKKYLIFGRVTQFDSATGEENFLASIGSRAYIEEAWYEYDQNSMVEGSRNMLKNIVEDDVVRMYVTVDGSYSYDTQIGGNTTVPSFTVHMIKVIGHA